MTPNSKLRIALISHHESNKNAGAAGADYRLGEALNELGCEVEYFFYDDVLPSKVRGIYRQILFPWFAALKVLSCHRRKPYSVIEATAGDAYLLRRLLKVSGLPSPVFSIRTHGLEHPRAEADRENILKSGRKLKMLSGFYHYRYRLNEITKDLSGADLVFLLNQPDRAYCIERLNISESKIHLTRNALPQYFFTARRSEFNPELLNKLIFVGGWIRTKGVPALVKIVKQLFAIDPDVTLTCAGVLTSREEVLKDFPPEFHGRISVIPKYNNMDLPAILKNHGIQIAPSVTEGCSISILECLSAGLIVLSTPSGSSPELIEDGKNGFLIPSEEPQTYVKTIQKLKADHDYAARSSQAAFKSLEGFTWDVIAQKRLELWMQLLEKSGMTQSIAKSETVQQIS